MIGESAHATREYPRKRPIKLSVSRTNDSEISRNLRGPIFCGRQEPQRLCLRVHDHVAHAVHGYATERLIDRRQQRTNGTGMALIQHV